MGKKVKDIILTIREKWKFVDLFIVLISLPIFLIAFLISSWLSVLLQLDKW